MRERLGKRDHSGFCRAVSGIAECSEPVDRAYRNDRAPSLLLHCRQHGMGAIVSAVEVAINVMLPGGGIGAGVGRVLGKSSIVDKDINIPERRGQLRKGAP